MDVHRDDGGLLNLGEDHPGSEAEPAYCSLLQSQFSPDSGLGLDSSSPTHSSDRGHGEYEPRSTRSAAAAGGGTHQNQTLASGDACSFVSGHYRDDSMQVDQVFDSLEQTEAGASLSGASLDEVDSSEVRSSAAVTSNETSEKVTSCTVTMMQVETDREVLTHSDSITKLDTMETDFLCAGDIRTVNGNGVRMEQVRVKANVLDENYTEKDRSERRSRGECVPSESQRARNETQQTTEQTFLLTDGQVVERGGQSRLHNTLTEGKRDDDPHSLTPDTHIGAELRSTGGRDEKSLSGCQAREGANTACFTHDNLSAASDEQCFSARLVVEAEDRPVYERETVGNERRSDKSGESVSTVISSEQSVRDCSELSSEKTYEQYKKVNVSAIDVGDDGSAARRTSCLMEEAAAESTDSLTESCASAGDGETVTSERAKDSHAAFCSSSISQVYCMDTGDSPERTSLNHQTLSTSILSRETSSTSDVREESESGRSQQYEEMSTSFSDDCSTEVCGVSDRVSVESPDLNTGVTGATTMSHQEEECDGLQDREMAGSDVRSNVGITACKHYQYEAAQAGSYTTSGSHVSSTRKPCLVTDLDAPDFALMGDSFPHSDIGEASAQTQAEMPVKTVTSILKKRRANEPGGSSAIKSMRFTRAAEIRPGKPGKPSAKRVHFNEAKPVPFEYICEADAELLNFPPGPAPICEMDELTEYDKDNVDARDEDDSSSTSSSSISDSDSSSDSSDTGAEYIISERIYLQPGQLSEKYHSGEQTNPGDGYTGTINPDVNSDVNREQSGDVSRSNPEAAGEEWLHLSSESCREERADATAAESAQASGYDEKDDEVVKSESVFSEAGDLADEKPDLRPPPLVTYGDREINTCIPEGEDSRQILLDLVNPVLTTTRGPDQASDDPYPAPVCDTDCLSTLTDAQSDPSQSHSALQQGVLVAMVTTDGAAAIEQHSPGSAASTHAQPRPPQPAKFMSTRQYPRIPSSGEWERQQQHHQPQQQHRGDLISGGAPHHSGPDRDGIRARSEAGGQREPDSDRLLLAHPPGEEGEQTHFVGELELRAAKTHSDGDKGSIIKQRSANSDFRGGCSQTFDSPGDSGPGELEVTSGNVSEISNNISRPQIGDKQIINKRESSGEGHPCVRAFVFEDGSDQHSAPGLTQIPRISDADNLAVSPTSSATSELDGVSRLGVNVNGNHYTFEGTSAHGSDADGLTQEERSADVVKTRAATGDAASRISFRAEQNLNTRCDRNQLQQIDLNSFSMEEEDRSQLTEDESDLEALVAANYVTESDWTESEGEILDKPDALTTPATHSDANKGDLDTAGVTGPAGNHGEMEGVETSSPQSPMGEILDSGLVMVYDDPCPESEFEPYIIMEEPGEAEEEEGDPLPALASPSLTLPQAGPGGQEGSDSVSPASGDILTDTTSQIQEAGNLSSPASPPVSGEHADQSLMPPEILHKINTDGVQPCEDDVDQQSEPMDVDSGETRDILVICKAAEGEVTDFDDTATPYLLSKAEPDLALVEQTGESVVTQTEKLDTLQSEGKLASADSAELQPEFLPEFLPEPPEAFAEASLDIRDQLTSPLVVGETEEAANAGHGCDAEQIANEELLGALSQYAQQPVEDGVVDGEVSLTRNDLTHVDEPQQEQPDLAVNNDANLATTEPENEDLVESAESGFVIVTEETASSLQVREIQPGEEQQSDHPSESAVLASSQEEPAPYKQATENPPRPESIADCTDDEMEEGYIIIEGDDLSAPAADGADFVDANLPPHPPRVVETLSDETFHPSESETDLEVAEILANGKVFEKKTIQPAVAAADDLPAENVPVLSVGSCVSPPQPTDGGAIGQQLPVETATALLNQAPADLSTETSGFSTVEQTILPPAADFIDLPTDDKQSEPDPGQEDITSKANDQFTVTQESQQVDIGNDARIKEELFDLPCSGGMPEVLEAASLMEVPSSPQEVDEAGGTHETPDAPLSSPDSDMEVITAGEIETIPPQHASRAADVTVSSTSTPVILDNDEADMNEPSDVNTPYSQGNSVDDTAITTESGELLDASLDISIISAPRGVPREEGGANENTNNPEPMSVSPVGEIPEALESINDCQIKITDDITTDNMDNDDNSQPITSPVIPDPSGSDKDAVDGARIAESVLDDLDKQTDKQTGVPTLEAATTADSGDVLTATAAPSSDVCQVSSSVLGYRQPPAPRADGSVSTTHSTDEQTGEPVGGDSQLCRVNIAEQGVVAGETSPPGESAKLQRDSITQADDTGAAADVGQELSIAGDLGYQGEEERSLPVPQAGRGGANDGGADKQQNLTDATPEQNAASASAAAADRHRLHVADEERRLDTEDATSLSASGLAAVTQDLEATLVCGSSESSSDLSESNGADTRIVTHEGASSALISSHQQTEHISAVTTDASSPTAVTQTSTMDAAHTGMDTTDKMSSGNSSDSFMDEDKLVGQVEESIAPIVDMDAEFAGDFDDSMSVNRRITPERAPGENCNEKTVEIELSDDKTGERVTREPRIIVTDDGGISEEADLSTADQIPPESDLKAAPREAESPANLIDETPPPLQQQIPAKQAEIAGDSMQMEIQQPGVLSRELENTDTDKPSKMAGSGKIQPDTSPLERAHDLNKLPSASDTGELDQVLLKSDETEKSLRETSADSAAVVDKEKDARLTVEDVVTAVQRLKETSEQRELRIPSHHDDQHKVKKRYYNWNTQHFYPDIIDSELGIVFSRSRDSSPYSTQYVEEGWIKDLQYYQQMEELHSGGSNMADAGDATEEPMDTTFDNAENIPPGARTEHVEHKRHLTGKKSVEVKSKRSKRDDMRLDLEYIDGATSSSSADEAPKHWHKSPLHVRRRKRGDERSLSAEIRYKHHDDGKSSHSPNTRRKEEATRNRRSPRRLSAPGSTKASSPRKSSDSGGGRSPRRNSDLIQEKLQKFEELQKRRKALESTSEESLTSIQKRTEQYYRRKELLREKFIAEQSFIKSSAHSSGAAPTIHDSFRRSRTRGEVLTNIPIRHISRSQEDIRYEGYDPHGMLPKPSPSSSPQKKDRQSVGKPPRRPSDPTHHTPSHQRQKKTTTTTTTASAKSQFDFHSLTTSQSHVIQEGDVTTSSATHQKSKSEHYRMISSSFENLYDDMDLSMYNPSMHDIDFSRYRQLALEGKLDDPEYKEWVIDVEALIREQYALHLKKEEQRNRHTQTTGTGSDSQGQQYVFDPIAIVRGADNQNERIRSKGPSGTWYVPSTEGEHDVPTQKQQCNLDAKSIVEEERKKFADYKLEYHRRHSENASSSGMSGDERRDPSSSQDESKQRPVIPPDDYEYILRKIHHQRQDAYYDDATGDGASDSSSLSSPLKKSDEPRSPRSPSNCHHIRSESAELSFEQASEQLFSEKRTQENTTEEVSQSVSQLSQMFEGKQENHPPRRIVAEHEKELIKPMSLKPVSEPERARPQPQRAPPSVASQHKQSSISTGPDIGTTSFIDEPSQPRASRHISRKEKDLMRRSMPDFPHPSQEYESPGDRRRSGDLPAHLLRARISELNMPLPDKSGTDDDLDDADDLADHEQLDETKEEASKAAWDYWRRQSEEVFSDPDMEEIRPLEVEQHEQEPVSEPEKPEDIGEKYGFSITLHGLMDKKKKSSSPLEQIPESTKLQEEEHQQEEPAEVKPLPPQQLDETKEKPRKPHQTHRRQPSWDGHEFRQLEKLPAREQPETKAQAADRAFQLQYFQDSRRPDQYDREPRQTATVPPTQDNRPRWEGKDAKPGHRSEVKRPAEKPPPPPTQKETHIPNVVEKHSPRVTPQTHSPRVTPQTHSPRVTPQQFDSRPEEAPAQQPQDRHPDPYRGRDYQRVEPSYEIAPAKPRKEDAPRLSASQNDLYRDPRMPQQYDLSVEEMRRLQREHYNQGQWNGLDPRREQYQERMYPQKPEDMPIDPRDSRNRDPRMDPRARDPRVDPRARDPRVDPRARDPRMDPRVRDPRVDPRARDPRNDPRYGRDPRNDPRRGKDPREDPRNNARADPREEQLNRMTQFERRMEEINRAYQQSQAYPDAYPYSFPRHHGPPAHPHDPRYGSYPRHDPRAMPMDRRMMEDDRGSIESGRRSVDDRRSVDSGSRRSVDDRRSVDSGSRRSADDRRSMDSGSRRSVDDVRKPDDRHRRKQAFPLAPFEHRRSLPNLTETEQMDHVPDQKIPEYQFTVQLPTGEKGQAGPEEMRQKPPQQQVQPQQQRPGYPDQGNHQNGRKPAAHEKLRQPSEWHNSSYEPSSPGSSQPSGDSWSRGRDPRLPQEQQHRVPPKDQYRVHHERPDQNKTANWPEGQKWEGPGQAQPPPPGQERTQPAHRHSSPDDRHSLSPAGSHRVREDRGPGRDGRYQPYPSPSPRFDKSPYDRAPPPHMVQPQPGAQPPPEQGRYTSHVEIPKRDDLFWARRRPLPQNLMQTSGENIYEQRENFRNPVYENHEQYERPAPDQYDQQHRSSDPRYQIPRHEGQPRAEDYRRDPEGRHKAPAPQKPPRSEQPVYRSEAVPQAAPAHQGAPPGAEPTRRHSAGPQPSQGYPQMSQSYHEASQSYPETTQRYPRIYGEPNERPKILKIPEHKLNQTGAPLQKRTYSSSHEYLPPRPASPQPRSPVREVRPRAIARSEPASPTKTEPRLPGKLKVSALNIKSVTAHAEKKKPADEMEFTSIQKKVKDYRDATQISSFKTELNTALKKKGLYKDYEEKVQAKVQSHKESRATDRYEEHVKKSLEKYRSSHSAVHENKKTPEHLERLYFSETNHYVDPDIIRLRKSNLAPDASYRTSWHADSAGNQPKDDSAIEVGVGERKREWDRMSTASEGLPPRSPTSKTASVRVQLVKPAENMSGFSNRLSRSTENINRNRSGADEEKINISSIKDRLFGPDGEQPGRPSFKQELENVWGREARRVSSIKDSFSEKDIPLPRYSDQFYGKRATDEEHDEWLFDFVSYKDGQPRRKSNINDALTGLEKAYENLDLENEELTDGANRREHAVNVVSASDNQQQQQHHYYQGETNIKRLSITNVKRLEEIQQQVENPSFEYAKRWLSDKGRSVEDDVFLPPSQHSPESAEVAQFNHPKAPSEGGNMSAVSSEYKSTGRSSLPRKVHDDMAFRKHCKSTSSLPRGDGMSASGVSYLSRSRDVTPAPSVVSLNRHSVHRTTSPDPVRDDMSQRRARSPSMGDADPSVLAYPSPTTADYLAPRASDPSRGRIRMNPRKEADKHHDDAAYRKLRKDVKPLQTEIPSALYQKYQNERPSTNLRTRSSSLERLPTQKQQQAEAESALKRSHSLGPSAEPANIKERKKENISKAVAKMVNMFQQPISHSQSAPDLREDESVFTDALQFNSQGDLISDDPRYNKFAVKPKKKETPRSIKQRHELKSKMKQMKTSADSGLWVESESDSYSSSGPETHNQSPPDGAFDSDDHDLRVSDTSGSDKEGKDVVRSKPPTSSTTVTSSISTTTATKKTKSMPELKSEIAAARKRFLSAPDPDRTNTPPPGSLDFRRSWDKRSADRSELKLNLSTPNLSEAPKLGDDPRRKPEEKTGVSRLNLQPKKPVQVQVVKPAVGGIVKSSLIPGDSPRSTASDNSASPRASLSSTKSPDTKQVVTVTRSPESTVKTTKSWDKQSGVSHITKDTVTQEPHKYSSEKSYGVVQKIPGGFSAQAGSQRIEKAETSGAAGEKRVSITKQQVRTERMQSERLQQSERMQSERLQQSERMQSERMQQSERSLAAVPPLRSALSPRERELEMRGLFTPPFRPPILSPDLSDGEMTDATDITLSGLLEANMARQSSPETLGDFSDYENSMSDTERLFTSRTQTAKFSVSRSNLSAASGTPGSVHQQSRTFQSSQTKTVTVSKTSRAEVLEQNYDDTGEKAVSFKDLVKNFEAQGSPFMTPRPSN